MNAIEVPVPVQLPEPLSAEIVNRPVVVTVELGEPVIEWVEHGRRQPEVPFAEHAAVLIATLGE